jgi:hypothetical protein
MSEFDHTTLSAYLDGELDLPTMREVEVYIDRNAEARRYVLDALHANVLLRASGRRALEAPVPAALENSLKPRRQSISTFVLRWSSLRPALAFAVLILGFGLGLVAQPAAPPVSHAVFPALPAAYLQAVNVTLENHLSGDPFVLETDAPGQRIVVTPTQTYRSRQGRYYRDYRLEVFTGEDRRQLRGLARRTGKNQWETTTIHYSRPNDRF